MGVRGRCELECVSTWIEEGKLGAAVA